MNILKTLLVAAGLSFTLGFSAAQAVDMSVTTTQDVVADDGLCSLREAVEAANTGLALFTGPGECPAGDADNTILLPDGDYFLVGSLRVAPLSPTITSVLSIKGASADPALVRLSGQALSHHFEIGAGGDLTLADLALEDGLSTLGMGGAISVENNAILSLAGNLNFINNLATDGGGAINNNGLINIIGNVLFENNSSNYGGAIYNSDIGEIRAEIDASIEFSANSGLDAGGAIYSEGRVNLTNALFSANQVQTVAVDASAGAVYVAAGNATLSHTEFNANLAQVNFSTGPGPAASAYGGALKIATGASVTLNQVQFFNNTSINLADPTLAYGGAIFHEGNSLVLRDCEVGASGQFNTAAEGGGIFASGYLDMEASIMGNNIASAKGGGLYLENSPSPSRIAYSTIAANSASSGAGIHLEAAYLDIAHSLLAKNYATGSGPLEGGGAVYNGLGGTLAVSNSTLSGNETEGLGGGIYNFENASLSFSTVAFNRAAEQGGGLYSEDPATTGTATVFSVYHSLIANNTSDTLSGGDAAGDFVSSGFNLLGNADISNGFSTSDLVNMAVTLEPLADNGGPTLTHALPSDSPAIDAGSTTVTATETDQRGAGFPRAVDGNGDGSAAADLGAFEFSAPIKVGIDGVTVSDGVLVDFGSTQLGTPLSKTLTIANPSATDPLFISSQSLPSGFILDAPLPPSIAAGASASVTIQVLAEQSGSFSGPLRFEHSGVGASPFTLNLAAIVGEPPGLQVYYSDSTGVTQISSGAEVFIGKTTPGVPLQGNFGLFNSSFDADLNLTPPSGLAAGFSLPNGFPSVVAPRGSDSFTVQMEMANPGTYSTPLTIFSDAPAYRAGFNLKLTGVVEALPRPAISISHAGVTIPDGANLDFAATPVGTPIGKTLIISNSGSANLFISAVSAPAGFTTDSPEFGANLPPGESLSVAVSLEARSVGTYSGPLFIYSSDPMYPAYQIFLSGTVTEAAEPAFYLLMDGQPVSNGSLFDFGLIATEQLVSQSFEIVNYGTAPLQIGAVSVDPPFDFSGQLGAELAPGESKQFTLFFSSASSGAFEGLLALQHNAPDASFVMHLAAQTEQPILDVWVDGSSIGSGQVINFGEVERDKIASKQVTLHNLGQVELIINGFSRYGDFAPSFSGLLPGPVPPGGSTSFGVVMDTANVGLRSGDISLNHNASGSPFTINFNGEVVESISSFEHPVDILLDNAQVFDSAPPGSPIGQFSTLVEIYDGEMGERAPTLGSGYTYSLVSGEEISDNAYFTLDGSGLLFTAAEFSQDAQAVYSIRVRSTGAYEYIEKTFLISVLKDNLPPSGLILSNTQIEENRPAGTVVGLFHTIDEDPGDVHGYALIGGADAGSFLIAENVLLTTRKFDYEVEKLLQIEVSSSDESGESVIQGFAISVIPQSVQVRAVSTGWRHSCSLRQDGSISCWGWDNFRQSSPPPQANFTAVSAGSNHACALTRDHTIECWGSDDGGQSRSPSGEDFIALDAGGNHNCALRQDNSVYCWGYNFEGQARAPVGNDFIKISAGGFHSCALHEDGRLECWGADNYGQSQVPDGLYAMASAGEYHTCAVTVEGQARCWGDDYRGQVSKTPQEGRFSSISAGEEHSCGLLDNGSVLCWGSNAEGQTNVPVDNDFIAIQAGGFHSCAVRRNDSVKCWGSNNEGQIEPPVAPPNQNPIDITLSNQSIPLNTAADTLLATLKALDMDPGDTHSFRLLSGDGADDNASFYISGDSLYSATELSEARDYSIRVEADDGNNGLLEKVLVLTVE